MARQYDQAMQHALIKPVPANLLARWVWQLQLHLPGAPVTPSEPLTQPEWLVLWRLRRRDATPLSVALETGLTPAAVRGLMDSVQAKYRCGDLATLQALVSTKGMPVRPSPVEASGAAF